MERKELIASVPWGVCVSTCTQHVGSFASRSQTSSMSTLKKPTEANYNICTCFFEEEIRILATTLELSQSRSLQRSLLSLFPLPVLLLASGIKEAGTDIRE